MKCEWLFFATSHGKGAVDGVGGIIKRMVWLQVKSRRVIINTAEDFYECAKSICAGINILYTSAEEVVSQKITLDNRWKDIKPIPNLQASHYFTSLEQNKITYGRTINSEKKTFIFKRLGNQRVNRANRSNHTSSVRLRYTDVYSTDSSESWSSDDEISLFNLIN